MKAFRVGEVVSVAFDNEETPGLVKARIVKLGHALALGQRYLIEVLQVVRPSRCQDSPAVGVLYEVAEHRISGSPSPLNHQRLGSHP